MYKALESNDLDVIVQVRKLGEGFDHKYLSVAAVFSIFANLSPFVQFVGRIMRVIEEGNPESLLNQGTVIFHAGSNTKRQWTDFQEFSKADQEYFQQLLPLEGMDFSNGNEIEVTPSYTRVARSLEIKSQTSVRMKEIPLLENDIEAQEAIDLLRSRGYSPEQVIQALVHPIPTTKQNIRRADRKKLDENIKTLTGQLLIKYKKSHEGRDLDKLHLGKTNFVVVKSEIDKAINKYVGMTENERHEFSQDQLNLIEGNLNKIVSDVERRIFNG